MDIFKSKYCPQLKLNKRFYLDNEPYSRRLLVEQYIYLVFVRFFLFMQIVQYTESHFFLIIRYLHKNIIFLKIIVSVNVLNEYFFRFFFSDKFNCRRNDNINKI